MLHKPRDILRVFKSSKILIGVFFYPLLLLVPYVLFINYSKTAYPELKLGYLSFLPFFLIYVFLNSLSIYFAISNYLAAVKETPPFEGGFESFRQKYIQQRREVGWYKIIWDIPITTSQYFILGGVLFLLFILMSYISG